MATVSKAPTHAILEGVTYDVYVTLRDHPRNGGLRMTYHDGTLELKSPAFTQESWSERIAILIRAYAATFDVNCLGARTTTFRKGTPGLTLGKGRGPGLSYYFANAHLVDPARNVDLAVDPPPDLWIEVDHRVKSAGRLPVLAALGVPEVWCYRARKRVLWFGALDGDAYRKVDRSLSLPLLTPALVLDFLAESERLGETKWDVWMRREMEAMLRPGH